MSGRMGDLNPKQELILQEFRTSLADVLELKHDDHLLLQFLRARSFDKKKAEDMLRKHLHWRKQYNEEYLLKSYQENEVLSKYIRPPFLGFDYDGSPVRLLYLGTVDIRGVISSVKPHELMRYIAWILETDRQRMVENSKKIGRHIETRIFIVDLQDLSLRQIANKAVLETIINILKQYEANYPENLKTGYVINIPTFFAWLFNVLKKFLSEDTIRKLRIFGHDGWKEDLLNHMSSDILPVSYGGTRTDPDGNPNCPSLLPVIEPVPSSYYLKNQTRLTMENNDVKTVQVHRKAKHFVDVFVDTNGCTIVWEIGSRNYDLGVGLFFKTFKGNEESLEEVLPVSRINCHTCTETGMYTCKKTGTYALMFDNSYSIIRNKDVLYRITILPPESSFHNESEHIL